METATNARISGQSQSKPRSPKVYVQVKVDFREDGVMLPREIIWEDGVT